MLSKHKSDDRPPAARAPRRKREAPAAEPPAEAPAAPVDLRTLRRRARDCRACDLWKFGTQTVFGEGPDDARVVLLGEQPGNAEDLSGHPFVGPAGAMLDQALAEVGLDRSAMYVTNVVKHFKFEARGKLRLHKRANAAEQAACRFWLDAELTRLQPESIVCLGALAAQAIFGRSFRLMKQRGQWYDLPGGRRGFATVHPSFLLRVPDHAERERAYADFVRDLTLLKA